MTQTIAHDDVQAIPVGQLFGPDAPSYSIPLYQRNYTWGEEQIHRLLYDILDEAEQKRTNEYFLGNLVVAAPQRTDEPLDVIDGQQRLTTLYILLTKLAAKPDLKDHIGSLQPLTYEARDKATRALRGVGDEKFEIGEEKEREDSGIIRASTIIEQFLDGSPAGARLQNALVIDYLLTKVLIIRMPIDRSADLNRYFEIMNTRGVQLSAVDIVKARLLRCLSDSEDQNRSGPRDRALLNRVWTACSDMGRYVGMSITEGSTAQRAVVFGQDWDEMPTADFCKLREQLIDNNVATSEASSDDTTTPKVSNNDTTTPKASPLTLDEAVVFYSQTTTTREPEDTDDGERFTSQITFPTLLLQVLAVRESDNDSHHEADRQLDDKQLLQRFSACIDPLTPPERTQWVRDFTTDLLRIRHLFDQYILKRDATLTTGHESTTDEEPGNWSLRKLVRTESRSGGRKQDTPQYRLTFDTDESGTDRSSLHHRILLLQSALRITYTSPRTMHWMTDILRYLTELTDNNELTRLDDMITAHDFLKRLESHTHERLREALTPHSDETEIGPDYDLALGFAIPRIVFTYLDYLLVEDMNEWDFTFSYRTSVEHFSPRTPDVEHSSPEYQVSPTLLDWFGNLALVTVSANSKFSNYQPVQKAYNHDARRQSLKLELMAQQAESGSWNDADVRAHHKRMVKLLQRALARA